MLVERLSTGTVPVCVFVDTQQCIICKQCKCRYFRYVDIVGRYSHLSQMLSSFIEFYTLCTFLEL